MGKILVIISLALTALTAVLGFMNKEKVQNANALLAQTEGNVLEKSKELDAAQKALKAKETELATAAAEKDQALSQATSAQNDLTKVKNQMTELTTQIGQKEEQVAKLTSELEAKVAEVEQAKQNAQPAVTGPDEETKVKMQEQETLIAKLTGDLDAARGQLEDLRGKERDRTAMKMRDGLTGRVLAVNQAWNFVVLNLGDKNGVLNNAEMLVKRGNNLIGKVRITSVEPSTSIADIVQSTVPAGINIVPGDSVIFQGTEN